MATIQPKLIPDMERIVEFDLVRTRDVRVLIAADGSGTGNESVEEKHAPAHDAG